MKTQHVSFGEALTILAQSIGYSLKGKSQDSGVRDRYREAMVATLEFFRTEFNRSDLAKEYCQSRGLPPEVLDTWEIGFAPEIDGALGGLLRKKGIRLSEARELFLVDEDSSGGYFDKFRSRLMFPIRDERGQLVAFGGRILGDGQPKYINSSDTPLFRKSKTLYGLNRAKDFLVKGEPVVLCEGYLDVIACHQAGVKTAVASLGTSLTEDHVKLLSRWTDSVVILYDADAAGEKAAQRASDLLEASGLKVRVAVMPPGEDPDTLLTKGGPSAVQQAVQGGLTPTVYSIEQILRRLKPSQDEFWTECVSVLADSKNELEVSSVAQRLASMHPSLRDSVEAYKAIRRMVSSARRSRRGNPQAQVARSQGVGPKLGIKSAETVLFRSVISTNHRATVWPVLSEPGLFLTQKAIDLATSLSQTFSEPPKGPLVNWLHQLQDEDAQSLLVDIELKEGPPLTATFVQETISTLQRKRTERDLAELKTLDSNADEHLKNITDRYRKLDEEKTAVRKGTMPKNPNAD